MVVVHGLRVGVTNVAEQVFQRDRWNHQTRLLLTRLKYRQVHSHPVYPVRAALIGKCRANLIVEARNDLYNESCFGAISAFTYKPPPLNERQPPSPLFALGLLSFVIASSVLLIYRAEERSRSRLGKIGEEVEEVAPPQPISLDAEETYSRYKAAISQNRFIEGAIAAIQKQDLMRCIVEIEQALEENKLSRESIDDDLYEPEEVLEIYKAALRVWMDGYPLDFGKLLQLRIMLRISNQEAEELENAMQNVSDAFVI